MKVKLNDRSWWFPKKDYYLSVIITIMKCVFEEKSECS